MRLVRSALLALSVFALVSTAAGQSGLTVKVGDVSGAPGQRAEVPIEVMGASSVGSMHIELVYDADVLQPVEKMDGALAGGAHIMPNFDIPGRVVLGLMSAQGINGDGEIAVVAFDVLGQQGDTSPLNLENMQAHDATTLAEIPTTVVNSTFRVAGAALPPEEATVARWVGGGTAALVTGTFVVMLAAAFFIVWQVTRRRQPAPVGAPPIGAVIPRARPTLSLMIGISAVFLVLLAVVVYVFVFSRPRSQVTPALTGEAVVLVPTDTPAATEVAATATAMPTPMPPTPTIASTSTPFLVEATSTPTLAPPTATSIPSTLTPTATSIPFTLTPTAMPIPFTLTPTAMPIPPTETPTATPAPPTATPTATPAPPTATAVPSPSPIGYPAPILLEPPNGASFAGGQVMLRWQWAGQLGPDEHFDVRVFREGKPHWGIAWTEVTEYLLNLDPMAGGTYYWSIAVLRGRDGKVEEVISPESDVWSFERKGGPTGEDKEKPPLPTRPP